MVLSSKGRSMSSTACMLCVYGYVRGFCLLHFALKADSPQQLAGITEGCWVILWCVLFPRLRKLSNLSHRLSSSLEVLVGIRHFVSLHTSELSSILAIGVAFAYSMYDPSLLQSR